MLMFKEVLAALLQNGRPPFGPNFSLCFWLISQQWFVVKDNKFRTESVHKKTIRSSIRSSPGFWIMLE